MKRRSVLHILKSSVPYILTFSTVSLLAQPRGFTGSLSDPAIRYADAPLHDAATDLNERLREGSAHFSFEASRGYLMSVLDALRIDIDSQVVVFSQTSADAPRITVQHPRAIFFNDTTAVAWVPGGDIEIAAQDPRQGVVFYVLKQAETASPALERQTSCLRCHISWDTRGVPGWTMLSTGPPDPNGYATGGAIDDRTPFAERWGGWFVTGAPGVMRHMGNVPVETPLARRARRPPVLTALGGPIDRAAYPVVSSDIVALMVLGHQTRVMNLITDLGWESRVGRDVTGVARELADALLFVDEAPITGTIASPSSFAREFTAIGPRDHLGRSLREFDLTRRMMKYACSYMIYSPAFDALPSSAKDQVYRRMWETLSKPANRAAVEILRDTKNELPDSFR